MINVIVTILETIFHETKVSVITAPTGSAAYNIGGATCHSLFGIDPMNPHKDLTEYKKDQLKPQFMHTLALMMDERSMISCPVLGRTESNCKVLAHNGMNSNGTKPYGGIPIIFAAGDDGQLGSVNVANRGRGAMYIFKEDGTKDPAIYSTSNTVRDPAWYINESHGADCFIQLAQNVVEFTKTHRVNKEQKILSSILKNMREHGGVTDKEADYLQKLNIDNSEIKQTRQEWLKKEATWIFPSNAKVSEKNYTKIKELVHDANPVCNLLGQITETTSNMKGRVSASHFHHEDLNPKRRHTTLCRGAKCAVDRNIFTACGVFNGAQVTVVEIRFKQNCNPNTGSEPEYVIVDCPSYTGPTWVEGHPTWIPIPVTETLCKFKCCKIRQVPLQLSFARTGQKFQGQQVGPEHHIKAMVADIGSILNEARNPGYTYMICSRVSTLGNGPMDSALYFSGSHTDKFRLTDMTNKRTGGGKYEGVRRKETWTKFLNRRKEQTNLKISIQERSALKKWATTTKITREELEKIIVEHSDN